MSKNKKLEERTRTYFIEAAKSILKGEGLHAVSARNVAEQAGYSYATLYNYFRDMKDLIYECMVQFRRECLDFIESDIPQTDDLTPEENIRNKVRAMVKYFVQYPGIFDLFYLEKTRELRVLREKTGSVVTMLPDALGADWEAFCHSRGLEGGEKSLLSERLTYIFTGMLLLFMNRSYPPGYQEFLAKLDEQLDTLFSCCGE